MNPLNPILIVDDSKDILYTLTNLFKEAGLTNTIACHDSRKVTNIVSANPISVLILDIMMPHVSGEDILENISTHYPDIPVIVLTGSQDTQTAVRCMKAGAFDYVIKKFDIDRLISSVNHALQFRELRQENTSLKQLIMSQALQKPEAFAEIKTKDGTMLSIFRYIESVAPSSHPVLITGETGTGKELFAQAVHDASGRTGKMITVNVAGFDDNMFSDTLFGHVRSAFTGADTVRGGLVEQATGGTLFIDEIGDLSLPSQVKLLRFIQDGEYLPLGSDKFKKSDARIIAATNRDLYKLHTENKFRNDLIYRLKTHSFNIPPLRERKGDIPMLVNYFVEKESEALNKNKLKIPAMLIPLLEFHSFPGNVRELEAMIFDAVSRAGTENLPLDLIKSAEQDLPINGTDFFVSLKKLPTIKQATNWLIDEAMRRSSGNQSVAAKTLGITQPALSSRMKKKKSFSYEYE
ncbi:MAG: sigma-54-dependent Fis family transcriptional regulator [Desulfobacteraceae bacterium]|nr:sigma-54-dependent Fis family transcriptional regulator [Desulfobacteraceae bacterium]